MVDPVAATLWCFSWSVSKTACISRGVHRWVQGLVLLGGKQALHDSKVRKLFVTQSRETSARPRRPQRACHRRTRPNQPSSCAASTAPI